MKIRILSAIFLLALGSCLSIAQKVNSAFYGVWNLDVARSHFGDGGAPKSGQVNWNKYGFIFALVLPDGSLITDATITDHGCRLIGVPSDFSETLSVISPHHVRIKLRQGKRLRRVGDIYLIDSKTTKTVHHVTPANGKPYIETTFWTKEQGS